MCWGKAMKKLATILLLLIAVPCYAQLEMRRFWRLSAAPASCIEGDGYYNTTTHVVNICTAANTWSALSGTTPASNVLMGTNSTVYGTAPGTANVLTDGSAGLIIKEVTTAPTASTATIAAGAGVNAGTHSYKITFVTASGETDAGAVSNTVTTAGGNLQVNLTAIPIGPSSIVTARKVYRTAAGNAVTGPWLLQSTIANNTATTLSDNTADAALTTAIPSTNTTLDARATFTNSGSLLLPDGTATVPAFSWASDADGTGTGLYRFSSSQIGMTFNGVDSFNWSATGFADGAGTKVNLNDGAGGGFGLGVPSGIPLWLGWGTNPGAPDVKLQRDAANTLALVNSNADQMFRTYGANGAYREIGSASELLTIAAAANTDTSATLLPANAYIEAVTVRVVTVIPTAATFTVGDPTTAGRFATGVSTAANTTAVGLIQSDQTGAAGPKQTAAAKVRITPNLSPATATGQVRITVFYRSYAPGTS